MREKRGQVTVFVVVGILLVAGVLLVLYLRSSETLKTEISKAISVPPQVQEVSSFLEGCLEQVAEEGIQLLGMQGGYTALATDPASLQSLAVVPGGGRVAYWYYEDPPGVAVHNMPSLTAMEQALEQYIDTHFSACADFRRFQLEGYAFSAASAASTVNIGDRAVLVKLEYPLRIDYKGEQSIIRPLAATLPSSLGHLYKIAQHITHAEHRDLFLENKTLDFMVVYDEIPYAGVDFNCQPKTWVKEQVKKDFQAILARNIPHIKFQGGSHTFTDKYFVQDQLALPQDIDVDFQYSQDWPFILEIIGHEKDVVLQGEPYTTDNILTGVLMPIFCLNHYQFIYTLQYPVLITLHKGDELFQFALLVNIDHNQPRRAAILPPAITFAEDTELCRNTQDQLQITTSTDGGMPLTDATVQWECVTTRCTLGKSDSKGELTATVPACVQGIVRAEKPGYQFAEERIVVPGDSSFSLVLDKIYSVPYEIFVVEGGQTRTLQEDEQAFVRFEHIMKQFGSGAVAPGQQDMRLIAGKYQLTSYLLTSNTAGIHVQAKKIKVCNEVPRSGILGVIGLREKKCTEETIPATKLEQVISGGNARGFSIAEADLQTGKKLQIFVTSYGLPRTYDALTQINEKIKKQAGKEPRWAE